MITYKGFELGPDSDLYDEDFYVASTVDEVIKELWSDIAMLKEALREANREPRPWDPC